MSISALMSLSSASAMLRRTPVSQMFRGVTPACLARVIRTPDPRTKEVFEKQGVQYGDVLRCAQYYCDSCDKGSENLADLVPLAKGHLDEKELESFWKEQAESLQVVAASKLYNASTEPVMLYVKYVSEEMGHGAFAGQDIEEGQCIAEYVGSVHNIDSRGLGIAGTSLFDTAYCCQYPVSLIRKSTAQTKCDSIAYGNEMRYANHDDNEQVNMVIRSVMGEDGMPHIAFFATRKIYKDEQLLWNYGPGYWKQHTTMSPRAYLCCAAASWIPLIVLMYLGSQVDVETLEQKGAKR